MRRLAAERPFASGSIRMFEFEYRGMAKYNWAFDAENFNCDILGYVFSYNITLPHPETKVMELFQIEVNVCRSVNYQHHQHSDTFGFTKKLEACCFCSIISDSQSRIDLE